MGADKEKFADLPWAVGKMTRGCLRGVASGFADCHTRAGYAARVLHGLADGAEIQVFATPAGSIAHSMVCLGGRAFHDRRDRSVMEKLSDYTIVEVFPVEAFLSLVDEDHPELPEDPFDRCAARVLLACHAPERAAVCVDTALDELLLAGSRSADGALGFDRRDPMEKAIIHGLEELGAVDLVRDDGNYRRMRLSSEGAAMLLQRWARLVQTGAMTDAEAGKRALLICGRATPADPHAKHALRSLEWLDEEGRPLDRDAYRLTSEDGNLSDCLLELSATFGNERLRPLQRNSDPTTWYGNPAA